MRNISDKRCRESQYTHFGSITFFLTSCRLWDHVEECCRAGQETDDYMVRAFWVLRTLGYKCVCRIYNPYWFFYCNNVGTTCLSVKLYVHCLSC